MNLQVLKKSHAKPVVGEVFALLPIDGKFLYGRVIATDAKIGPMEGCNLVYIYRPRSSEKSEIPSLVRGDLLVPPMITNNLPWKNGYFERLCVNRIEVSDILPQHCFVDSRGWYFDEKNNQLEGPVEPLGERGLQSFRTIDDRISRALGIPLSA